MIPKNVEAEILRLFHAEKWRIGTIATRIGLHHSTVARVLSEEARGDREPSAASRRPSRIDEYLPFIHETLERHPGMTSKRLFDMVAERGYVGSADHFRHVVQGLRTPKRREVFLRLRTLPGEEAQVDWAQFGRVRVGRAERRLCAFVMVLSYSRRLFLRFCFGDSTTDFLRGHEAALAHFGGCPRRILYDNLKSAVLDRRGDAIRFNPDLIAFCARYRFEPRPVAPYRGNEKGRVERAIRYARSAFYDGLSWSTLAELNAKALAFCDGAAMTRPWPEDRTKTVAAAFAEEATKLLPLPASPVPILDRVERTPDKTGCVRFDLNDYSVPRDAVGKTLTVLATVETVRILDGSTVVAEHCRSFDKGALVEDQAHRAEIVAEKRHARKGRSLDRLSRAAPESTTLLVRMAERGGNVGSATLALTRLLDAYGADELRFGLGQALARGVFHPHAVRQAIERRRGERGLEPMLPIPVRDDPRITDLTVTPHDLGSYDRKDDHGARTEIETEEDRGEGRSGLAGAAAAARAVRPGGVVREDPVRAVAPGDAGDGGGGAAPPQPGAADEERPDRPLPPDGGLRLEVAEEDRP